MLAGMEFQRRLEKAAYKLAEGKIPCQMYDDYKNNIVSGSNAGYKARLIKVLRHLPM